MNRENGSRTGPQPRPDPRQDGSGPLAGIRVLDVTQILAGPYATMLLADLGAEVIKVERPEGGDETRQVPPTKFGESHYFMSVNRNKRGVAIDLKRPQGRHIVQDLARQSDIFVENFRPGVVNRLGLDYATLSALNPRLVYCSISAFGQTGPWAGRGAFDVAVQALSGAMSVTGEPGEPPVRMGLPVADLAGGMLGVVGILAALHERTQTGRGRFVDVGLLDSMVGMLGYLAGRYFMTGEEPGPVGSRHHSVTPYGAFAASDGYIVIATFTDSFWRKLCDALGVQHLGTDPNFATAAKRAARRAEVDHLIEDVIRTRTVAEWQERLGAADIPHAPILSLGQVLQHPQVEARGLVQEVEHPLAGRMPILGRSIRFSGPEPSPLTPPPLLGQHTRDVLENLLRRSPQQVDSLIADGVVAESARVGSGAGSESNGSFVKSASR